MKIHNQQEPEFDSIIFVNHNLAANKESKTNEFRFVYDLYARQIFWMRQKMHRSRLTLKE